MKDDIKEEATEAVHFYVKAGFDDKESIFDNLMDMFYDEDDFDEAWLRSAIEILYDNHQKESLTWKKPTDFDKLSSAFDTLIHQKIICLQWAGSTKQMAVYECEEVIKKLKAKGVNACGYCYYHVQDLERAVEPESRDLYLGFDSTTQDNREAVRVGNMICQALAENGFQYVWNGTVHQRVRIENINWQKVPDGEDYGKERVLKMMIE